MHVVRLCVPLGHPPLLQDQIQPLCTLKPSIHFSRVLWSVFHLFRKLLDSGLSVKTQPPAGCIFSDPQIDDEHVSSFPQRNDVTLRSDCPGILAVEMHTIPCCDHLGHCHVLPAELPVPVVADSLSAGSTEPNTCFSFFICLETVASGQDCIDYNTTSARLSVLGCNLCRAGDWGGRPPPLTKTHNKKTFNDMNRVSACSHHCDACTRTTKRLASSDGGNPMPDDSSPLPAHAPSPPENHRSEMPDQPCSTTSRERFPTLCSNLNYKLNKKKTISVRNTDNRQFLTELVTSKTIKSTEVQNDTCEIMVGCLSCTYPSIYLFHSADSQDHSWLSVVRRSKHSRKKNKTLHTHRGVIGPYHETQPPWNTNREAVKRV